LEVRVLDEGPDPGRRRSIEQALAGKNVRLASIKAERACKAGAEAADVPGLPALADLSAIDPVEILTEAHRWKHGGAEPAPALLAVFREILASEASNGGEAA
jgi:exonuclease SbcD